MKVEQACRFRLDEGYCIFAKSAGLMLAQEQALGDIFNSAMNTIFPKLGASVLSCAPGKNDAFYARNTLRTDILGRKTIFTHAYIFDAEEYARYMDSDPTILLSIPMEQMLDSQAPDAQMEQLELSVPAASGMQLESLFEKYHLTPVRYGKLLIGAYEALTSNASLRLKTKLPLEQTEQMVRELTYCILHGLLPVLKGRVSFSSGADTRMKISVIPAGDDSMQASDIVFGVEEDGYTNIRPKDEISAMAFDALGKASHAERAQILANIQAWLNEVTDVQEGLSVMLISVAYCMSASQALSADMLLLLFRSITAASKNLSKNVVNSLLTTLVRKMNELGACSPKALSQIAAWYLKDSNDGYRREADKSLLMASAEICAELVEVVLEEDMTDNIRQMLHTLLQKVPADSGMLEEESQSQLVLWILSENVESLSQYAAVLLENFNDEQMMQLGKGILQGIGSRRLTGSEDVILSNALDRLTKTGMRLSEEECAMLDNLSSQYSDTLRASALDYLFRVRFATKTVKEGLLLLDDLALRQPQYFAHVYRELVSGNRNCNELWEHHQTARCFRSEMTVEELVQVCTEQNVFNNPGGIFEQNVASRWLNLVSADFFSYSESAQMQYYVSVLIPRWEAKTAALQISPKMKAQINEGSIKIFWDTITYKKIAENEHEVPEHLRNAYADAQQKIQVMDICLHMRKTPTDATPFINLVQKTTDQAHMKKLKECLKQMTAVLLKSKRYLSWDLILLYCWEQTEEGGDYNLDALDQFCEKLDPYMKKNYRNCRIEASDSIILRDEKIAKNIMRLGNDVPDLLYMLIDQLKSGKKGLLQNLFGGRDKKSSSPYEGYFSNTDRPRRQEQTPASNKRSSGKGNVYDPTDLSYGSGYGGGEKKGKGKR